MKNLSEHINEKKLNIESEGNTADKIKKLLQSKDLIPKKYHKDIDALIKKLADEIEK